MGFIWEDVGTLKVFYRYGWLFAGNRARYVSAELTQTLMFCLSGEVEYWVLVSRDSLLSKTEAP